MVDIVIVNWNSGDFLKKCIDSILINTDLNLLGQIFIIDNYSTDHSLETVTFHEKIMTIHNTSNQGFSKACNQGFKMCRSPYVLLLNPDTEIFDTTLVKCVEFLKANTSVDILGCTLLNDSNVVSVSCARFPTPLHFFYDALGLSKLAPRIFTPALLMTDWDHKESKLVDQVMGAFMFMRSSIFVRYGYFDERFFVYYEELDFSKRVTELGGHVYFNADIKAKHSGCGTTASVKAHRLFLNLRSRLQYAKKHFTSAGFGSVWFCTCLLELFTRNIFLIIRGNFKEIPEVFRAYKLLSKDKTIQF